MIVDQYYQFIYTFFNILLSMDSNIKVKADFSGGLDLVFDGKTEIALTVKEGNTIANLIRILAEEHANSKKEMFYLS